MTPISSYFFRDTNVTAELRAVDGGYYLRINNKEFVRTTLADVQALATAELAAVRSQINPETIVADVDAAINSFLNQIPVA